VKGIGFEVESDGDKIMKLQIIMRALKIPERIKFAAERFSATICTIHYGLWTAGGKCNV
jgi:hypothetical protein